MTDVLRIKVLRSMQPLIEEAESKCLWFFSAYQQIWLSPQELRDEQSKGNFLWGPTNWQLRDPQEHEIELKQAITNAQANLQNFQKRWLAPTVTDVMRDSNARR